MPAAPWDSESRFFSLGRVPPKLRSKQSRWVTSRLFILRHTRSPRRSFPNAPL